MEGQGGLVTSHRGPEDRDGEGGNDSLLCRMQERRGGLAWAVKEDVRFRSLTGKPGGWWVTRSEVSVI